MSFDGIIDNHLNRVLISSEFSDFPPQTLHHVKQVVNLLRQFFFIFFIAVLRNTRRRLS